MLLVVFSIQTLILLIVKSYALDNADDLVCLFGFVEHVQHGLYRLSIADAPFDLSLAPSRGKVLLHHCMSLVPKSVLDGEELLTIDCSVYFDKRLTKDCKAIVRMSTLKTRLGRCTLRRNTCVVGLIFPGVCKVSVLCCSAFGFCCMPARQSLRAKTVRHLGAPDHRCLE